MEQMKTLYQIDQNIHYVGAGTQQPAEIPNLKPAVSDFVREYLLRNSHSPWILNCLRNPSSCDKGTVLNMTHLTISFFFVLGKGVATPPEARTIMPRLEIVTSIFILIYAPGLI